MESVQGFQLSHPGKVTGKENMMMFCFPSNPRVLAWLLIKENKKVDITKGFVLTKEMKYADLGLLLSRV